jgi:hypothetical protein
LQRVRALVPGFLVGLPVALLVYLWLHATREFAVLIGLVIGTAIFLVVSTSTDGSEIAADDAWREAAPDLPPFSDRMAMERDQASIPGPETAHKTARAGHGRTDDSAAGHSRVAASK